MKKFLFIGCFLVAGSLYADNLLREQDVYPIYSSATVINASRATTNRQVFASGTPAGSRLVLTHLSAGATAAFNFSLLLDGTTIFQLPSAANAPIQINPNEIEPFFSNYSFAKSGSTFSFISDVVPTYINYGGYTRSRP